MQVEELSDVGLAIPVEYVVDLEECCLIASRGSSVELLQLERTNT